MSNFNYLKIFLTFIIFSCLFLLTKEQYVKELEEYSVIKCSWNASETYVYYIDIDKYDLNDENVIQILGINFYHINNIIISEINESIIIEKY